MTNSNTTQALVVFQYCKCTILVQPVLYNTIYTILDFRYCSITILVFLVLYSVTILVLPISRCNCKDNALLYKIILYKVASLHFWKKLHFSMALILGDKFPIWRWSNRWSHLLSELLHKRAQNLVFHKMFCEWTY